MGGKIDWRRLMAGILACWRLPVWVVGGCYLASYLASGLIFEVWVQPHRAFVDLVLLLIIGRLILNFSRRAWAFAALMGISLSSIFLVFTHTSIVRVFFITAATFGAISLWGYTTKRDISGMGSFLFMGLIGIVIASIVNIFLGSSMLQFIVSVVGVLVFAGLTAWDTQRLKNDYIYGYGSQGGDIAEKAAITGALSLYLNFINLFTLLLQLLGQRD